VVAVSRGAGLGGAHLDTSATAAEQTNRNAGFIRQAGEWDWGCRMNPVVGSGCAPAPKATRFPFALRIVLLYKSRRYVRENILLCVVRGAYQGGGTV